MSDAIGHCLPLALEAVVPRSYPPVALNAAAARSFQEIRGAGRAWASKASTQTTGAPLLDRFLAAGAVQVKVGLLGLQAPADKMEAAPFHEEHMHVRFPAR
jgi:hypothetical protein